MYKNLIRKFSDNFDALRSLVDLINPNLLKDMFGTVKNYKEEGMVLLHVISKMDPQFQIPADKIPIDEILKKHDLKLKLKKEKDGKVGMTIVGGKNAKDFRFDEALAAISKSMAQQSLLFHGFFITSVSLSESFLSQVIFQYFSKYQHVDGCDEKTIKFKELRTFDSLEEVKNYLVESKVLEIMRGGFEEWVNFLKTFPKISLSGYLDADKDRLVEVFQRRNVWVHNDGLVNGIYLSKVSPELKKNLKKGKELSITPVYIRNSMNLLERNFLLMTLELWKKLEPENEERAEIIENVGFRHLNEERWQVAKGLYYFGMMDKEMPEGRQMVAKINYWQCCKWLGEFKSVEDEIKNADFSAIDGVYSLGRFALLDDFSSLTRDLPDAIKAKDLKLKDLETWPLFKEYRKSPEYEKVLKKIKPIKKKK